MSKKSKSTRINKFVAKQTSAPQPIYHQPAHSPQPHPFQARVVIPKASAHVLEDAVIAVEPNLPNAHSRTRTHTPPPSSYHTQHMLDNSSQHSGQTQRTLLPTIKLYQYSNFSNNSNSASTQLSSATNNSNSSVQSGHNSGYSDTSRQQPSQTHRTHTYHVYASPAGPAHPHTPSHQSHSETYSHVVQPVAYEMYHAYYPSQMVAPQIPPAAIPSFAHSISAQSYTQQIIPRSSTGNINLLELDAQIEDHIATTGTSSAGRTRHRQHSLASQKSAAYECSSQSTKHGHMRVPQPNGGGGGGSAAKTSKQSELEYFNHDIRAYNIWVACLTHHADAFIFFCVLYPYLCAFFTDVVCSKRCPTQNDLRPVLKRHGAVANAQAHAANTAVDEHSAAATFLCINKNNFLSFWKWFKESCQIIRELRHLWEPCKPYNSSNKKQKKDDVPAGLGLNLFCTRQVCEHSLLQSEDGTFCLRLSATICGGMVLSYVDNSCGGANQKQKCKHVILVRQANGMYQCKQKTLLLHHIIRNFVKLKSLYTPNRAIPKEKVF